MCGIAAPVEALPAERVGIAVDGAQARADCLRRPFLHVPLPHSSSSVSPLFVSPDYEPHPGACGSSAHPEVHGGGRDEPLRTGCVQAATCGGAGRRWQQCGAPATQCSPRLRTANTMFDSAVGAGTGRSSV